MAKIRLIRWIGEFRCENPQKLSKPGNTRSCRTITFGRSILPAVYGRRAPLEVDLGCGDGSFLVASAESKPEHEFLGIERLAGRVGRACRNIERRRVTNARVLLVESSYAVEHLLPPASVEVFHLLFPDPWPKRRHWRRRVVTNDFLSAIHRALVPQGTLRIATDQMDYFQEIERLVSQFALLCRKPGYGSEIGDQHL